jgi:uncharacterized glyoxalase superfamily protein PhnB
MANANVTTKMPPAESTLPARLERVVPVLPVEDVNRAIDWYRSMLGFQVEWTWGSPVAMASVCRDAVALNLAKRSTAASFGCSRVYVEVSGVDSYYADALAAGVAVTAPLEERSYRMRDFGLRDPDGNELHFGEPVPSR